MKNIQKFDINFSGYVRAEIQIVNNKPVVLRAINGWGNPIKKDNILIAEVHEIQAKKTYCGSENEGGDRCQGQCLGCAGLEELKSTN